MHSKIARLIAIVPGSIGIALFVMLPTLILLWFSLHSMHVFSEESKFIGFSNFKEIFNDRTYLEALFFTCRYALTTVILQLVIGIVCAWAIVQLRHAREFLLGICLLPYILPTIIVAVIWKWLLHDTLGIVNRWGADIGLISRNYSWFAKESIFMTLVIVSVWQFFPFVLLMFYARLNSIPKTMYESASIDGLGPWGHFWFVTLPLMKPVIITVILLRGLWMFTKFDTIWLLAGREAIGRYAYTLPILSYITTFDTQQLGLGSAISMTLVSILLIIVLLYLLLVIKMYKGSAWQ